MPESKTLTWKETPDGNYKAGGFTVVKQDMRHATHPYVLFQFPFAAPRAYGTLDECKAEAEALAFKALVELVS